MTYTLRDGSETEDIRLGRLKQFDERSFNYPIREFVRGKARPSYTWRADTWLDQGPDGACVGFACAHEIVAKPKEYTGIDYSVGMEIYHAAQRIDPWPGGSYPSASPRYEGTSILAGVKVLKNLGYIDEYRWAFGVQDLAVAVARFGPAIVGVPWYSNMFDTDTEGFLKPTGQVVGGHAILVRGYNKRRNEFLVRNSWGKNWGVNGDFKLTYQDMDYLLKQDGEAVIPVKRNFQS